MSIAMHPNSLPTLVAAEPYQEDVFDAAFLQQLHREADEWLVANVEQGFWCGG